MSYRHPSWKRSAYLAVFQHDEASPVRYKVKAPDEEEKIVDTSEDAIELVARLDDEDATLDLGGD